jgi:hypothetical protein
MANIRTTLAAEIRSRSLRYQSSALDHHEKAARCRQLALLLGSVAGKCERGELDDKFDELLPLARLIGAAEYVDDRHIAKWRRVFSLDEPT